MPVHSVGLCLRFNCPPFAKCLPFDFFSGWPPLVLYGFPWGVFWVTPADRSLRVILLFLEANAGFFFFLDDPFPLFLPLDFGGEDWEFVSLLSYGRLSDQNVCSSR